jgi:hypothetical protein
MVNPYTMAVQKSTAYMVRFDDFVGLPKERGDEVCSSEFLCFGHEWCVVLYPGGEATAAEGSIAIFIRHLSYKKINVMVGFSINGCMERITKPCICTRPGRLGFRNFEKRLKIMDCLLDGALVIEVRIELANLDTTSPRFVPNNPSCRIIQSMFMDEKSADIVFEVGGQQFNDDATKKVKTSSVRFPGHRLVLCKSSSSTLAELCRSLGDEITSPIHVPDVSPDVFRCLLYHLYGGEVLYGDKGANPKDILDAADRYGVVDLKLQAEACLVDTTAFTIENFMDLLLYADSKNCALLKEAAIDFMLENKGEVRKKMSFNDAPRALLGDVLTALERKEKKGGLSSMRVDDLRWHSMLNGLDVDGSREMLIAALEEDSDEEPEEKS